MKLAVKILATMVLVGFVASAGSVGWFLYEWSCEMSPQTYVRWLDTDPAVYANVDSISESDLHWFAYAYDENQFADAIPRATRISNLADSNKHHPAFKLGDDIFVLTRSAAFDFRPINDMHSLNRAVELNGLSNPPVRARYL